MECWKNGYTSKSEAQRVASGRRRRKGVPKLYVYQCPNCGLWHLTRNNPDLPDYKLNHHKN